MGIVGYCTFVVDQVDRQDIGCRKVVVLGIQGIGTLQVLGKWVVVGVVGLNVVELEEHCLEIGCFGGGVGFVVTVVDNWVDLNEQRVDSNMAYVSQVIGVVVLVIGVGIGVLNIWVWVGVVRQTVIHGYVGYK